MDRATSSARDEFRFLTTDEFKRLTQREKVDYLARAVEETLGERPDTPIEVELFVDQDRPATRHQQRH